ncbi:TetR family transcriptional regulator [Acinetobacter sp. ANC 4558]|uniref:ABC transporter substrate-binding protein n=1 Tax=Acinetobacter sp. ANC 4558 TaxID=1977876 RepID=UPI000A32BF4A|nr:ABC transporter substrate-binding protein [Acinetobacter sp. ANC 4558]OTG84194.1 TetR family transcriptional regulator [Acinetobacter sp. ANC 4558]
MRNFTRKIIFAITAASAFIPFIPSFAAENPTVIRIGVPSAGEGGRPKSGGSYHASAHLRGAIENEFKKDGIKVNWTFFPGAGPALNEALSNGKIDFATHGDLPAIVGRSTGLKTKVILSAGRFSNAYFTVPADSSAKNIRDLKGKTIATFKGTNGQLALGRLLEKHGLSEKDFKVISQDTYSIRTSLATGDIDGAITNPWSLEARGVAKRIYDGRNDRTTYGPSVFWVTEAFENKYPEIVQRVVNASLKQAYWSSQEKNREEQYRLWAQTGLPYLDYKRDWDGVNLKEKINPLLDPYFYAQTKKSVQQSKDYKLIRRDVDVDSWVEPKYLKRGLVELGLENYWPQFDANIKPIAGTGTQTTPTKTW